MRDVECKRNYEAFGAVGFDGRLLEFGRIITNNKWMRVCVSLPPLAELLNYQSRLHFCPRRRCCRSRGHSKIKHDCTRWSCNVLECTILPRLVKPQVVTASSLALVVFSKIRRLQLHTGGLTDKTTNFSRSACLPCKTYQYGACRPPALRSGPPCTLRPNEATTRVQPTLMNASNLDRFF